MVFCVSIYVPPVYFVEIILMGTFITEMPASDEQVLPHTTKVLA